MSIFNVPKDDRPPRHSPMYRKEKTECEESGREGGVPIFFGDWKCVIHKKGFNDNFGFRRYHRHGKRWYCVVSYSTSSLPREEYPWENLWKCGKCNEHTSEDMEGYLNLARWATDEG